MRDRIIPKKIKDFLNNYLSLKNPYIRYLRNCLDSAIQTIILIIVTCLICTILLYVVKMSWHTFIYSPVGKKFLQLQVENASIIQDILKRNLLSFAISITLIAFKICLTISAICHVSHVSRYFYLPRGLFGKVLFWGLPLTLIVALNIQKEYDVSQLTPAFILSLVPTLSLFAGCFKFAGILLPEMGDIYYWIKSLIQKYRSV